MTADPRDLHIPLTEAHPAQAQELCDLIASCSVSAREAFFRGSYALARHHVGEARTALVALIPLANRLSDTALSGRESEAA